MQYSRKSGHILWEHSFPSHFQAGCLVKWGQENPQGHGEGNLAQQTFLDTARGIGSQGRKNHCHPPTTATTPPLSYNPLPPNAAITPAITLVPNWQPTPLCSPNYQLLSPLCHPNCQPSSRPLSQQPVVSTCMHLY